MSKVRNLPQTNSLDPADILYAVDVSAGPNGGRKITAEDLKTSVAQSPVEIKTAYESNPDTNAFTDAEKSKLAGVEAGATADQSAAEVPYDNSTSGLSATQVQSAIDELSSSADFRPSISSGRILHYTGGTARFDDAFFEIAGNDILLAPNITNGTVYVDLDGIVKQTLSNTTPPPYTIVIALFSTDLNNITGLVDQRVKNAQNIVRGMVGDIRDVRAGAAADAGSSGRVSDAMHKHNILTGAASTQNPDQANAEGVSANLARADHVHNIPTDAPTTNLSPATTNAEGIGTSFARNDHTHSLEMAQAGDFSTVNAGDTESLGTADRLARADHQHPVATAAATGISASTTNTEGAATSLARADHTHAIATGVPSSQAPDQANAAGSSANLARADHVHNIPADAPTTTLSPATTNAEGVGVSFARNDHTHAVATGLVGDLSTLQPDDSAAAGTVDRFARADHKHAIVTAAASTQTPDQANAKGVSTSFARADHVHNIPTAAATGLNAGSTNTQGAAATFARSDHTHAIASGTPSTVATDATNAAGSSTNLARADHIHQVTIATQTASDTADDTTTSATDTLMNSMTATPAAGTYLVMWSGSIVNSANGTERTWISLYSGGSQVSATERSIGTGGGSYTPASTHAVITVNGSQAIELRWRVAGGTSTVHSRRLTLVRVS